MSVFYKMLFYILHTAGRLFMGAAMQVKRKLRPTANSRDFIGLSIVEGIHNFKTNINA